MRRMCFTLALVMAGICGSGNNASAQNHPYFIDPVTKAQFPTYAFYLTQVQSKADHTFARAGCSQELARLAHPTIINGHYAIGTVGGGKLVKGDGPAANGTDGIFGWDYVLFGRKPNRIFLGFQHDRPHQMLNGKYEPDKPRLFDVFTIRPARRAVLEKQAEREGGGEE